MFLLSLSGPDALHHGRCGSDRQLRGVFSSRSSTSLSMCRDISHGLQDHRHSQLLDTVIDVPVVQVVQLPCSFKSFWLKPPVALAQCEGCEVLFLLPF